MRATRRGSARGLTRQPVPARLPAPGPSFLREQPVQLGDRLARAGMSRPTTLADGWWLTLLWVVDDDGVVAVSRRGPARRTRRPIHRSSGSARPCRVRCPG